MVRHVDNVLNKKELAGESISRILPRKNLFLSLPVSCSEYYPAQQVPAVNSVKTVTGGSFLGTVWAHSRFEVAA